MKLFTIKPNEKESTKARARILVLALVVFTIWSFKPDTVYANGAEDFEYAYNWKLIESLSGLPKTGDKNVFTDTDWYPIFMGVKANENYSYLAKFRSNERLTRNGETVEVEKYTTCGKSSNAFPYDKTESTTFSDYDCMYIKYAGKNLNGKDVYYLKRDDGKILVNSVNSEHKGWLVAVEREDLKKELNPGVNHSTWEHYGCHIGCWYEGLHTWEFIQDNNHGRWHFAIRSGGCKYKECLPILAPDDAGGKMTYYGKPEKGCEESKYFFSWEDPKGDTVKFCIHPEKDKCFFSVHIGSYQKVNRILKPMKVDSEYRITSEGSYSLVAPEADITVANGGTLIVEDTVIWSGWLDIARGGTLILCPGAKLIMLGNKYGSCLVVEGNMIVANKALFYYGGNRFLGYNKDKTIKIEVQGGSIYNNGTMLMGNSYCKFDGGGKLEVGPRGEVLFGKSIKSNQEFTISYVDDEKQAGNYQLKTMFPEILEILEETAPGGVYYTDKYLDSGEKARGTLSLGDNALIRNNGKVKLAECKIDGQPAASAKWIGDLRWEGNPAEGNLPDSLYKSVQTWD